MNRPLLLIQVFCQFLKRGLLAGLFLICTYVFLATQIGLNSVVWVLKRIVPGELKVTGLHGRILGTIGCSSIFYQDEAFSLSISELSFHLKLWRLISKGQIFIRSLTVDSVSVIAHNNQTPFQIPPLLEKIRLASFSVKQLDVQVDPLYFECQGTVDQEWQLNWQLSVDTHKLSSKLTGQMEFAGTVIGTWNRTPQLQLTSRSQPFNTHYMDEIESIQFTMPSIEWQGAWQSTGLKTNLLFAQAGVGAIKASIELPNYQGGIFPKAKQIIRSEVQVNLSNWDKLYAIFSRFLSPVFDESHGTVEGSLYFQSSIESLIKGWREPALFLMSDQRRNSLLRKFFIESPSMQLDLIWKQPTLPKLGMRFDAFSFNAILDHNQIVWNSNLKAIENNQTEIAQERPSAKWNLNGKTKLVVPSHYELLPHASSKAQWRFSTQLKLTGDPLLFFNTNSYQLVAKPLLNLTIDSNRMLLEGMLDIPSAQIHLGAEEGSKAIVLDEDILFTDDATLPRILEQSAQYFPPLYTQVKLVLGQDVQLSYDGLVTYLDGVLKLTSNPHQPLKAWGELSCRSGHYNYYGQILNLDKNSRLVYTEFFDKPKLDISASKLVWVAPIREADLDLASPIWQLDVPLLDSRFTSKPIKAQVGFRAKGPIDSPHIYLYSEPSGLITSQADLLSYLLTGQSSRDLSAANAQLLLDAAYQLSNFGKTNSNLIIELQKKIGLDYLNIQSDPIFDPNTHQLIQNTAVILGKRITPKLYVSYSIGLIHSIRTLKANYFLNRYFSLEGSMSRLNNSVDLLFQTER